MVHEDYTVADYIKIGWGIDKREKQRGKMKEGLMLYVHDNDSN